ncbi:uncharacterized protein METZ01_LOCUS254728, partial [marine metagenome]
AEIPKIDIRSATATVAEGATLPTFLTVTRTGSLVEPLEVGFIIRGGAEFETDYTLDGYAQTNIVDGKFYFPAGLNQVQIEVAIQEDDVFEGIEQIMLRVNPGIIPDMGKVPPPLWYAGSINMQTKYYQSTYDWMPGRFGKLMLDIEDNDPPALPLVTVALIDGFANENGRDVAIVELVRVGDISGALEIPYVISGSAENNLDYVEIPDHFTFEAGQARGLIVIRPNEDRYIEGIENLVLTVAPGDTFSMAAPVEAEILIIDNEFPVISIAAVDALAMEEEENAGDNRARLLVSRTGDHYGELTVNYLVSGSASKGLDYEPLSGSVVIRAGDISAVIRVTAEEDSEAEGDEYVGGHI